jgi:signal transduction histidine kinase
MRRQLTIAAAAIATLIVIAFLIPLGVLIRTIATDRALQAAQQNVSVLVPVVATVDDRDSLALVVRGLDTGNPSHVSVLFADGTQTGRPVDAVAEHDDLMTARSGRAFSSAEDGGMAIYAPVARRDGVDVVRAFVPNDLLHSGVTEAWAIMALLGIALVGVATIVADRLAQSIVRPVRELAATAEQLGQGHLDVRVAPSGPREIVEVGQTLNVLAARIGDLLTAERESVADLSHRLRTPVTALRLDAEAIADDGDRARLVDDVDALQAAVDRQILDARRPGGSGAGPPGDLAAAARRRMDFWSVLAEDQGRASTVVVPDAACPVPVTDEELDDVLDALLGNVFAHTPDGVPFKVVVSAPGTLVVEDEGPGLPDGEVLGRGVSGHGSTGLGLDIVRRAAESAGGAVVLGTAPGGGARVEVRLGPAPAAMTSGEVTSDDEATSGDAVTSDDVVTGATDEAVRQHPAEAV